MVTNRTHCFAIAVITLQWPPLFKVSQGVRDRFCDDNCHCFTINCKRSLPLFANDFIAFLSLPSFTIAAIANIHRSSKALLLFYNLLSLCTISFAVYNHCRWWWTPLFATSIPPHLLYRCFTFTSVVKHSLLSFFSPSQQSHSPAIESHPLPPRSVCPLFLNCLPWIDCIVCNWLFSIFALIRLIFLFLCSWSASSKFSLSLSVDFTHGWLIFFYRFCFNVIWFLVLSWSIVFKY